MLPRHCPDKQSLSKRQGCALSASKLDPPVLQYRHLPLALGVFAAVVASTGTQVTGTRDELTHLEDTPRDMLRLRPRRVAVAQVVRGLRVGGPLNRAVHLDHALPLLVIMQAPKGRP